MKLGHRLAVGSLERLVKGGALIHLVQQIAHPPLSPALEQGVEGVVGKIVTGLNVTHNPASHALTSVALRATVFV